MKKDYNSPATIELRRCAKENDILKNRMFYEDFLDVFHTMSEDELREFDLIYSYSHHRLWLLSQIYRLWSSKKFESSEKYCLIAKAKPQSEFISEGRIIKVDPSFVIHSLTKSFIEKNDASALYAPEWCKCLRNAGNACVHDIIHFFPLSPKQIGIEPCADYRVNKIWIAVPDVRDNISLLERAMSFYGYTLLKKEEDDIRSEKYETKWATLIFAPDFQEYVDDKVYENNKYFYHISPSRFEKRILKQGLVPKSSNNAYHYPPRVYIIKEYDDTFGERKLTKDDIMDLARRLAEAKLLYGGKSDFIDEYNYTVYRIKTLELSENTNFSYDMDFYPLGIFTAANIPPYALEVVGRFDVRKETGDMDFED